MRLKPWVGSHYGKRSNYGLKILIFGESHYQWVDNNGIQNGSPKRVVRAWIKGQYGRSGFGRRLPKVFRGDALTDEETGIFWNNVAFTNYVQENVPLGKKRPTKAMWEGGTKAFPRVVKELAPDCIIVASKMSWNIMPAAAKQGPSLRVNGVKHETWLYPTSKNRYALATWLPHPSRRDFRYKEIHPMLTRAINKARLRANA